MSSSVTSIAGDFINVALSRNFAACCFSMATETESAKKCRSGGILKVMEWVHATLWLSEEKKDVSTCQRVHTKSTTNKLYYS